MYGYSVHSKFLVLAQLECQYKAAGWSIRTLQGCAMDQRAWLFFGTGAVCLVVAALAASSIRWPDAPWARRFAARHLDVAAPQRQQALVLYAVGYGVAGVCWLLVTAVRVRASREGGASLLPLVADVVMLLCLLAAVRSLGETG